MIEENQDATIADCISKLDREDSSYFINHLIQIGKPAVPALAELLRNPDADGEARCSAAQTIGHIGGKGAYAHLLWALSDSKLEVRVGAAMGLEYLRRKAAIPYLIAAMLKDNDERRLMRHMCGEAIVLLGGSGAAEEAITDAMCADDPIRREKYCEMLEWIGEVEKNYGIRKRGRAAGHFEPPDLKLKCALLRMKRRPMAACADVRQNKKEPRMAGVAAI